MAGYSPERAMREFLRRGGATRPASTTWRAGSPSKRRELLQRHNLDGTLEEVRELLDHAVLEERKQLARDVDLDDADRAFREMQLENLPASHGGRGERAVATTTGRAARRARTTSRSRTCSAASCSTSASPA